MFDSLKYGFAELLSYIHTNLIFNYSYFLYIKWHRLPTSSAALYEHMSSSDTTVKGRCIRWTTQHRLEQMFRRTFGLQLCHWVDNFIYGKAVLRTPNCGNFPLLYSNDCHHAGHMTMIKIVWRQSGNKATIYSCFNLT